MVEKWKKGILVGKKGGTCCSTPSPTWRLDPYSLQHSSNNNNHVSARKLCANLWQFQHTPFAKMNEHGGATTLRRCLRHRITPPPPDSTNQTAPYKCVATPGNSIDSKGMSEEPRYNLTTSTKLLNVLNQIWSLEEQHTLNVSSVKALKAKRDHFRTQMKALIRVKQTNREEIENLVKQMTMKKFVTKNREHERIKASVELLKEDLEDEKRLRKHSESLHRKLARELSEVKSSFSGCLRNLERERKARILLENLCDEFAKGIKSYEQVVHCLRQDSENGQVEGNNIDRLILHISEAWLDERVQMKLAQSDSDFIERISIVDKIGFDIEAFLNAKRGADFKKYGYSSPKELKEIDPCQHSIESLSAPQNMDQEDSIENDSFELKEITVEGLRKLGSKTQRNNGTELHREKGSGNSIRNEVMAKEITQCSIKLPKGVKENTLLAKLLEARLEGQRSRSKVSKKIS